MNRQYEYLRYDYTEAEIAEAARDLASANRKRASLEQRKKEVDSAIKAEIEAENTSIGRLSNLIATGFEYRDIEVRVELDTPEEGKKRIVRLDTGEEVAVKRMTDEDRQMVLDLQTKAEAAEAKEKAEKEPIVTPPPVLRRLEAPAIDGEVTLGADTKVSVMQDDGTWKEVASVSDLDSEAGATLAPAALVGGTHQKGTKQRRGARNPAAEAYVDGSAEEYTEEPAE